jgi:hypothetical protein
MKIDKFSPEIQGKICLFFFCLNFFHIHSFTITARENKAMPSFPLAFYTISLQTILFSKIVSPEAPLLFQKEPENSIPSML